MKSISRVSHYEPQEEKKLVFGLIEFFLKNFNQIKSMMFLVGLIFYETAYNFKIRQQF